MELEHSFTVPVGIDRAWEVLLDVETIAPCMPGAALDTIDGDEFTGTVKVKLGPIGLTYKGKAAFVEKDEAAHRAVIDAQGRDSRGNGTAAAKVTATLESDGEKSTKVVVSTDLAITGKPAQFGRGVMVDVGNKLIGQFADCLAGKLTEPAAVAAEPAAAPAAEKAATKAPAKAAAKKAAPASASSSASSATTAESTATAGAAAATTPTADAAPKHAANGTAPAAAPAASTGPRKVAPVAATEPIDLMASAGPAVAKRLVPVVGAAVLALVALLIWRRRR